jgi:hypothetical protein
LPTQSQSSIEQLTGTVDIINSRVQLMTSGTENWLNITIESVIARGDRIRTGDTGVALVTWFEDGASMEVGPNTELVIDEFSGDEDRFVIEASLLQGSLFNSVRGLLDPESRYQVLTPSVSATVRGTIFSVSVDDDLNSVVAVTEGTVNVAGYDDIDNAVDVEEGNFVVVDEGGGFAEVVDIDAADDQYAGFVEALTDFEQRVAEANGEEASGTEVSDDADVTEVSDGADVTETSSVETNDEDGTDENRDGGPPPHANAGGGGPPNHANPGSGNRADQADENANNPGNSDKEKEK